VISSLHDGFLPKIVIASESLPPLLINGIISFVATENPEEMERQRQDLENIMMPFLIT